MAVTKKELTEHLYNAIGLSRAESKDLVEAFFNTIREALVRGEEVNLYTFGKFTLREKRARPGRNPKTGEPSVITARRVVIFHPSHVLKDRCDPSLSFLHERRMPGDQDEDS